MEGVLCSTHWPCDLQHPVFQKPKGRNDIAITLFGLTSQWPGFQIKHTVFNLELVLAKDILQIKYISLLDTCYCVSLFSGPALASTAPATSYEQLDKAWRVVLVLGRYGREGVQVRLTGNLGCWR